MSRRAHDTPRRSRCHPRRVRRERLSRSPHARGLVARRARLRCGPSSSPCRVSIPSSRGWPCLNRFLFLLVAVVSPALLVAMLFGGHAAGVSFAERLPCLALAVVALVLAGLHARPMIDPFRTLRSCHVARARDLARRRRVRGAAARRLVDRRAADAGRDLDRSPRRPRAQRSARGARPASPSSPDAQAFSRSFCSSATSRSRMRRDSNAAHVDVEPHQVAARLLVQVALLRLEHREVLAEDRRLAARGSSR